MNPAVVDAMELELAGKCDQVFATAQPLAERLEKANPHTAFIPNGANFSRFYEASKAQPCPEDLKSIPRPILGFVGALQPCIAYDFVAHAAKAHPEWSFVFIGGEKPGADLGQLKQLKNCYFLGLKPNEQLPQYMAQFAVCLNLFAAGDLSKDVSPLKFYEYLATGKPIVSTPQPDQVLQFRISSISPPRPRTLSAAVSTPSGNTIPICGKAAWRRDAAAPGTPAWPRCGRFSPLGACSERLLTHPGLDDNIL